MSGDSATRFDALDLLRGVAAIAVMTLHIPRSPCTEPLLPHAYLAVDLFFALSGFVIARVYGQRLKAGEPVGRFMLIRLIRFYPLFLLCALLGGILLAQGLLPGGSQIRSPGELVTAFAANLFFLPAPPARADPAGAIFPLLFPAWSLFWELVANFLFALLLPKLTSRLLTGILALGIILLVATGAGYGTLNAGPHWPDFWGGGGRVLWSFFAGVAIERVYARMRPLPVVPGWVLALLLIGTLMAPSGGSWPYDVLAALFLPVLVILGAQATGRSPLGYWLGYASYAVYVVHVPLLTVLNNLTETLTGSRLEAFPMTAVLPVAAGLTLVASFALTRFFDEPARAWLRRKLLPRRPRRLAATA